MGTGRQASRQAALEWFGGVERKTRRDGAAPRAERSTHIPTVNDALGDRAPVGLLLFGSLNTYINSQASISRESVCGEAGQALLLWWRAGSLSRSLMRSRGQAGLAAWDRRTRALVPSIGTSLDFAFPFLAMQCALFSLTRVSVQWRNNRGGRSIYKCVPRPSSLTVPQRLSLDFRFFSLSPPPPPSRATGRPSRLAITLANARLVSPSWKVERS